MPEEYWHKQNFCWYIHDVILSIFDNCIEDDKISTNVVFKNDTHAKQFNKTEDVLEWLFKNGYKNEADAIIGKRVFHAILADMLHFIYESLSTIERGKITVSLALLRKPFRDNLLYLEWLLGYPEEIIKLVFRGDINNYAIESISPQKKKQIIKVAISNIDNQNFFTKMNEEVYFDLRYNSEAENSLQRVWNSATHLVTTRKNYRSTEFNFVFLNEKIHLDFIDYYYKQLPHLLFYTYCIVVKLYDKFIRKIPDTIKVFNNSLVVFKFTDLTGAVKAKEYFNKKTKFLLQFPCLNCKKVIKVNIYSKEFEGYKNGWGFNCPECNNIINTCKYVFWKDL